MKVQRSTLHLAKHRDERSDRNQAEHDAARFGTLKATFYTLLISVPLAIMAAIYSSEFMDRKWRGRVKPAIELMASIPSVVLGFTSAFVLAPWLRDSLDWALTAFFLVPIGYLLAAHLWCLLPVNALIRWNWIRLPLMALSSPCR